MADAGDIEVSELFSSSSTPTSSENVVLRDATSVYFYDKNGRKSDNFSIYLGKSL